MFGCGDVSTKAGGRIAPGAPPGHPPLASLRSRAPPSRSERGVPPFAPLDGRSVPRAAGFRRKEGVLDGICDRTVGSDGHVPDSGLVCGFGYF